MRLRYVADLRTLVFVALLGGAMVASLAGAVPLNAVTVFLLGLAVFVANIVKHNHVHCPTFTSRGANIAMNVVLTLLTGTSCTGIIVPHQARHHRAPQSPDDFVRSSLVHHRVNALNLAIFPFVSMLDMARRKPSELLVWRRHKRMWRLALLERGCAITAAVVALATAPRAAIVALVWPWLFGQCLLLLVNLLQHQHLDPRDARHSSRDIVGRLSNAVFFNAGFHSAHHAAPGLHWSLLPQFHAEHIAGADRAPLEFSTLASLLLARLRAPGIAAAG